MYVSELAKGWRACSSFASQVWHLMLYCYKHVSWCPYGFICHRKTMYARPRETPFHGLHQRQRHAVQRNNACGPKPNTRRRRAPEQPNNTSLRPLVPLDRIRTKRSAFCQIVRFWALKDNVAAAPAAQRKTGHHSSTPTRNTCQRGHVPTTVPRSAPRHMVDSYGALHCHDTTKGLVQGQSHAHHKPHTPAMLTRFGLSSARKGSASQHPSAPLRLQ